MIVDEAIRAEALDPKGSFIVQAPAGSGKTGLLTQRLLSLLAHCQQSPEECLALTFTRKAAFEMQERILAALRAGTSESPPSDPYQLKTWTLAQAVLEKDKKLGWNLLQNPTRLKIQTLDALCASLASTLPILSQFGSMPKMSDDPSLLYQAASYQLLKSIEEETPWSEAVRALLLHLDNHFQRAVQLLSQMLSHRDQWLPYMDQAHFVKESRQVLEQGLSTITEEALSNLVDSIPREHTELLALARFAGEQVGRSQLRSAIQLCEALEETWPDEKKESLPLWLGLAELLCTQDHALRKRVTEQQGFPAPSAQKDKVDKAYFKAQKDKMNEMLARLADSPLFLENLKRLRECPPCFYTEIQWGMIEALVTLLPVLVAELSLAFQEKGEVDFIEVAMAAHRALGESETPTDLALRLDYKIQHILVDEFQDTSLSQFRLLEKLTLGWQPEDGRTLFLVGDPMQSIYRFRQAEVGLFIRAKQKGIGHLALKSLTLTANFRSDPTLVEWTNTFFQSKFPKKDDIAASAIAFTPSTAVRVSEKNAEVKVYSVTLETESQIVIEHIQKIRSEAPKASIALLVRSRHHLKALLPALRDFNIPYQGIQLEPLLYRTEVQDLLSLTKALLHLGDKIAWLSLLRTPWAFLSLRDLTILAEEAPHRPLWHTLKSCLQITTLSPEGRHTLERVVPILSEALVLSRRIPLRDLVTQAWLALGGAQHLSGAESLEEVEAFLEVLEASTEEETDIEAIERRVALLYATPNHLHPNALQVMTIHKAKGLEFDYVIVPGVGRKGGPLSAHLLLWEERVSLLRENYFVLAPIKPVGTKRDPIYQYLKQQEEKRQHFESIRVEYVAATRARLGLYWLVHEGSA